MPFLTAKVVEFPGQFQFPIRCEAIMLTRLPGRSSEGVKREGVVGQGGRGRQDRALGHERRAWFALRFEKEVGFRHIWRYPTIVIKNGGVCDKIILPKVLQQEVCKLGIRVRPTERIWVEKKSLNCRLCEFIEKWHIYFYPLHSFRAEWRELILFLHCHAKSYQLCYAKSQEIRACR